MSDTSTITWSTFPIISDFNDQIRRILRSVFFYSFFRVPERVFVQHARGSPPPKAQKCQQLLKQAHTAKHWLERREPSQFASEKTVKTMPVAALSSSQWRERGREGKLFASWVIFVLGMTQKSKEVMKMTQSVNPVIHRTIQMAIRNRTVLTVLRWLFCAENVSVCGFNDNRNYNFFLESVLKNRVRIIYGCALYTGKYGNVPDAPFEKRYSTKAKNTCKYKPKGKGDGVWYMYLDTYLCKLCLLYLLGLQNLLQPQIE